MSTFRVKSHENMRIKCILENHGYVQRKSIIFIMMTENSMSQVSKPKMPKRSYYFNSCVDSQLRRLPSDVTCDREEFDKDVNVIRTYIRP